MWNLIYKMFPKHIARKLKCYFLIIIIVDNAPSYNSTISAPYENIKVLYLLPNTIIFSDR